MKALCKYCKSYIFYLVYFLKNYIIYNQQFQHSVQLGNPPVERRSHGGTEGQGYLGGRGDEPDKIEGAGCEQESLAWQHDPNIF